MANCLYNAQQLPALPEYDTAVYTRAVITRILGADGLVSVGAFLYLVGGDVLVVYDSGDIYLSHTKVICYSSANTGWNLVYEETYDSPMWQTLKKPGDSNSLGVSTGRVTVWSSFDIYNEDGTLYLAASEPVPIVESAEGSGFSRKSWLTGYVMGLAGKPVARVLQNTPLLQEKTVTAALGEQVVTCDAGFDGLSSVTVVVNKPSAVSISRETDAFTITFKGGTSVSGSVTFDDSGIPVSMSDDQGNSLSYTDGFPDSVTDSDGNKVTITEVD